MSELENLKAFLGLPDGWLEVAEHYPPDRLDSRGYDWCGHDPLCTTLWEHLNKGWAVLRDIVEKAETERDQVLQHAAAPKYKAALEEIKRDQGRVCDNYELCRHTSCSSSYSAWAIADKALRNS